MKRFKKVFITGGAGYVGAVLVPQLARAGYGIKVLDLFMYGKDVLAGARGPSLEEVQGDLRDAALLKRELAGCDAVIHLACISNDPSFALDPELSRSINYDAFEPLVRAAKEAGVRRFIYASTSSVYGVSDAPEVAEDHPLVPITDYNKYKGLCEPLLFKHQSKDFVCVTIRPATVCGWSPRLRLDLTVNILAANAYFNGEIKVFGGRQMRPNIHIGDMADLYQMLLELPDEMLAGKTFNAGYENRTVSDIADLVAGVVRKKLPGRMLKVVTMPSDDIRSYHISSEKIRRELGFSPKRTLADAVSELLDAFEAGKVPAALNDDRYVNIRVMQKLQLR